MEHMVSLHLNAAKLGFTQRGEQRNGPYRDAGQREYIGQQLLQAISQFYHRHILHSTGVDKNVEAADISPQEAMLEEAFKTVLQTASFFKVNEIVSC